MPEDLKARVAAAAKCSGTSTHGFILEAIVEKAAQENLRADFDAVAEERYARIVASGETIPWQEMRGYLEERLAGNPIKSSCPQITSKTRLRVLEVICGLNCRF